MSYVIDPSVALAWLLPDETNADADAFRAEVEKGAATWIPGHWWLEVSNGLLMAERRGRITPEKVAQALSLIKSLPFQEDAETADQIPVRTLTLARNHGLTIYDAVYLELAQRRHATLATQDSQLLKAAKQEKISIR